MADDDRTGALRGYAADMGVDPPVNGANNVQAALEAGGGIVLGNNTTDVVAADAPTALTGDGAEHFVGCVLASPPAWMDGASNIIEPGLYNVVTYVSASAGPTTPGLAILVQGTAYIEDLMSCDFLADSGQMSVAEITALAIADVPYEVNVGVTMPTDATEAVGVQNSIYRLAH